MRASIIAVLVLFITGTAAAAQTYEPTALTAAQILERSRAAYGTLEPGTYEKQVRIHAGEVDHIATTLMSGKNGRTTYSGGGFSRSNGTFDGQDWTEDENGIVTLDSNFRTKVDPNVLALKHPDDPKYNVRVLGMTQTAPAAYVIELNPPDGFDQLRYYDATTWLLQRIVSYTRDRFRHVADFSGYRSVFGRMQAFSIHSYDGRPQNDDTSTVLSFEKVPANVDFSIPYSTPIFTTPSNSPVQVPARFTPQGIIIRAIVNGRGLDFLLDSGASGLFIDPGVAHELGLTAFGRSAETIGGGDIDYGRVRIAKMTIGSLDLNNVVFTTAPMDDTVGGSRIVGLIGFDFLASGIFGIDFKAQRLTLYPRDHFDPKAMGLIGVPLQLDDGVPRADVWMEGVLGHFMVDTGSGNLLIYHDFAQKLPSVVSDSSNGLQYSIRTVGGSLSSNLVDISNLVFGRVEFRSAQAIEPSSSTFDTRDYDGLIGRDVLSCYSLYFDYNDGTLYVKPNI